MLFSLQQVPKFVLILFDSYYLFVYMYVCMYVCVCVCMHLCMYVCTLLFYLENEFDAKKMQIQDPSY